VLSNVSNGASLVLFNSERAKNLRGLFESNGECGNVYSLSEAMGNGGQLAKPSRNDLRTDLIYILYRLFGLRGPKLLYKLDRLRMRS
jgi:hypothetical protein